MYICCFGYLRCNCICLQKLLYINYVILYIFSFLIKLKAVLCVGMYILKERFWPSVLK